MLTAVIQDAFAQAKWWPDAIAESWRRTQVVLRSLGISNEVPRFWETASEDLSLSLGGEGFSVEGVPTDLRYSKGDVVAVARVGDVVTVQSVTRRQRPSRVLIWIDHTSDALMVISKLAQAVASITTMLDGVMDAPSPFLIRADLPPDVDVGDYKNLIMVHVGKYVEGIETYLIDDDGVHPQ